MHEAENLSLEVMGPFVEASEEIRFESENREQVYGWLERVRQGLSINALKRIAALSDSDAAPRMQPDQNP